MVYGIGSDGSLTFESTPFSQGRIVNAANGVGGCNTYYFSTDYLGSVRSVSDVGGNQIASNDYYPFGGTWHETLHENRYLYNGKEKQTIGGVDYLDYGARMYDPQIGRWTTPDPLAEKYAAISPYGFCGNNPIRFVDHDGKKIIGVNKQDAANFVMDLRNIFKGDEFKEFRNLIIQSGRKANSKEIASIGNEALNKAFEGITLNADQQAMVNIAVNTINSSDKHFVEYATDKVISEQGQNAIIGEFSMIGLPMSDIINANGGIPTELIANFGGDGLTIPTPNGSYSIIVGNNHNNGRAVTTGHEIFGHGRSIAIGRGSVNQHIDAVRTENLILRVMGINYINNGSTHGPRVIISNPSALPEFR